MTKNTCDLINQEKNEIKVTVATVTEQKPWHEAQFQFVVCGLSMGNNFPYLGIEQSLQAVIRYNKLCNYDIIGIHCTAPSKIKLIYI